MSIASCVNNCAPKAPQAVHRWPVDQLQHDGATEPKVVLLAVAIASPQEEALVPKGACQEHTRGAIWSYMELHLVAGNPELQSVWNCCRESLKVASYTLNIPVFSAILQLARSDSHLLRHPNVHLHATPGHHQDTT